MFILFLSETYKDASETKHILIVSHWGAIASLTGKDLKNTEFVILSLDQILNPKKNT
jgi:hypothetical protein